MKTAILLVISFVLGVLIAIPLLEYLTPPADVRCEGPLQGITRMGHWTCKYMPDEKLHSEGDYRNGKQHGKWVYQYENGQKKAEGDFNNGNRVKEWTEWYENGQETSQGEYNQLGKRSGPWKFWRENGNLECEGAYRNDVQIGVWTYYKENGEEAGTLNYGEGN